MSEHTAGPWRPFYGTQGQEWIGGVSTYEGEDIAFVVTTDADIHLIAAAPKLLSMSGALVAQLQALADALREAGKDFANTNPHAARPNLYEMHEQQARIVITEALAAIAQARGQVVTQ